ncbi:MAG TPA: ComEC/Rec2 family competence protein [Candidatus Woesebacteria bacterium]|jgi:competence protein ComEC|nr:ComEC/Rec2 family competence protein [Candidatus Woesebacteria bacterium]
MRKKYGEKWWWVGAVIVVMLMYKFIKKESLIAIIDESLTMREAGLLKGMLWGDKTGFGKEFYNQLKDSGLVHLVVVSGSNMMLVFRGTVEWLAKFLGRKKAIGVGFLLSLGYLEIVGWEIPVVRALILIGVMYWAQILGRKYNLTRGLILSVLIIVAAWPESIKEVSFWLSFLAFIGVVTSPWKGTWGLSLWVSLWISPVMGLVFGKINLVGPISNLLVLLTVEVITVVGLVGSMVGLIIPMVGRIILWTIWPLLRYFGEVVGVVSQWWWANLGVNFNWLIGFGWYVILIWGLIKLKNRET